MIYTERQNEPRSQPISFDIIPVQLRTVEHYGVLMTTGSEWFDHDQIGTE